MDVTISKKILPVTDILHRIRCLEDDNGKMNRDAVIFCYESVLRAIKACLDREYHRFDGHTATQCCHGISLLVHDLLANVADYPLLEWYGEGQMQLQQLQGLSKHKPICPSLVWSVPANLIDLAILYLIAFSSEYDEYCGRRIVSLKLRSIGPVGRKICGRISRRLQREISNRVASRYHQLAKAVPHHVSVAGISAQEWGKYVAPRFLRKDCEGRHYTSHLFSMQVMLADIVHRRLKVVLLSDLMTTQGERKGRYIQTFVGNGYDGLIPVGLGAEFDSDQEPVLVLAGCCYSDELNPQSLDNRMRNWIHSLDHLLLACEAHCEQFPRVQVDPGFDRTPVIPSETKLQKLLSQYKQMKGVSVEDPSLFCLFHVYLASYQQVREAVFRDPYSLPSLPISGRLRGEPKSPEKNSLRHCA